MLNQYTTRNDWQFLIANALRYQRSFLLFLSVKT